MSPITRIPSFVAFGKSFAHRASAALRAMAFRSSADSFWARADMPKEDYDKWYAQSWLDRGDFGVRVGPRYPFPTTVQGDAEKQTWVSGDYGDFLNLSVE